ncbi:MAG: hypothetical protein CVU96_02165, partial [Firmicutes bacterium HGW-Firmicutes-20]
DGFDVLGLMISDHKIPLVIILFYHYPLQVQTVFFSDYDKMMLTSRKYQEFFPSVSYSLLAEVRK